MNVILILRIFLTAAGVLFLLGDINAYVRQKLTDACVGHLSRWR